MGESVKDRFRQGVKIVRQATVYFRVRISGTRKYGSPIRSHRTAGKEGESTATHTIYTEQKVG
jgi:hypothetical protein